MKTITEPKTNELEYNPAEDVEYQKLIDSLAPLCRCSGVDRPCDGLLAGGLCDNLHFGGDGQDRDEEHED